MKNVHKCDMADFVLNISGAEIIPPKWIRLLRLRNVTFIRSF